MREVYGRAYHKLLVNLRALHPALEDLVLVDAYGKVIGGRARSQATRALHGRDDGGARHRRAAALALAGRVEYRSGAVEIEAVLTVIDGISIRNAGGPHGINGPMSGAEVGVKGLPCLSIAQ